MNVGSQLPDYERILFPGAAIELCLVQVRFPSAHRFTEERHLSAIKEALADDYPLSSIDQSLNIVVGPQGVMQTPAGTLLRFSSINHAWSVVLAGDLVSIETRQYTDINELVSRFVAVLELVVEYLHPRIQQRFGMRYVNEFRFDGGEDFGTWQHLLNPSALGVAHEGILGGTIEQTITEARTKRDDGTLLVRHGFLQGTTVMPIGQRQPKIGPFYLLDLDYYDETPIPFDTNPAARMRTYNDALYRIFRWFVDEGPLYKRLKGEYL